MGGRGRLLNGQGLGPCACEREGGMGGGREDWEEGGREKRGRHRRLSPRDPGGGAGVVDGLGWGRGHYLHN